MTDGHVSLPSNGRWTETEPSWPDRPAWFADAECAGLGPDLFFTDASGQASDEAIAVCAVCPVRERCLEWALANNDTEGVWGGTTPAQRRRIRRRRSGSAAVETRRAEARRLHELGLNQFEIADRLGVAQPTVSAYLDAAAS